MTHMRRQIRQAIAAKFTPDSPAVFKRVETDRVHAIDAKTMLPCMEIEFRGEEIAGRAMRAQGKIRTMQFAVRITAQASALQDKLDELAMIVEARLGSDLTLGGLVMHIVHSATEPDISADGESRLGSLSLTYTALVTTPEDNAAVRA